MSADTSGQTDLPRPGVPRFEWIESNWLARWTFASADEAEQLREFLYWCGWFGYAEDDRPEKVEGNVWIIRSSIDRAALKG